jgi:hypothetical protein
MQEHCQECPYNERLKRKVWCKECFRIRTNKRHAVAAKKRRQASQLKSLHLELDDELAARLNAWAGSNKWPRGEAVRVILEHELPELPL